MFEDIKNSAWVAERKQSSLDSRTQIQLPMVGKEPKARNYWDDARNIIAWDDSPNIIAWEDSQNIIAWKWWVLRRRNPLHFWTFCNQLTSSNFLAEIASNVDNCLHTADNRDVNKNGTTCLFIAFLEDNCSFVWQKSTFKKRPQKAPKTSVIKRKSEVYVVFLELDSRN